MAVRPDGSTVGLPNLWGGTGLVYVPGGAEDLWLLELPAKKTRLIARLTNHGEQRAFDITPDGRQIVFDRVRENSDIVLIEFPPR